jgi:hypothetical protein
MVHAEQNNVVSDHSEAGVPVPRSILLPTENTQSERARPKGQKRLASLPAAQAEHTFIILL